MMACRKCGCTENDPCVLDLHGVKFTQEQLEQLTDAELELRAGSTCSWIEVDLCSACLWDAPAPLLVDHLGRPLRGTP